MATNPKIKPCPSCGRSQMNVYKYDNGWCYVECDGGFNARPHCGYMGPGEGSVRQAIKSHNAASLHREAIAEGSVSRRVDTNPPEVS